MSSPSPGTGAPGSRCAGSDDGIGLILAGDAAEEAVVDLVPLGASALIGAPVRERHHSRRNQFPVAEPTADLLFLPPAYAAEPLGGDLFVLHRHAPQLAS